MNTYQLLVVAAIKVGIPIVLSYLAFKASLTVLSVSILSIPIATIAFIIAIALVHITMEDELKYYN